MRRFSTPLVLAGLIAAGPAAAQIQPDVTVNPNATGTKVLLYPGGKYGRVQRPLLQPGEADPNAPIVLHMPAKRKIHRIAKAKPKPQAEVAQAAPAAANPPAPPPAKPRKTLAAPPPESAASLFGTGVPEPPPSKPPPKQQPAQVAKQTPPPKKSAPPPSDSDTSIVSGTQASQPPPSAAADLGETNVTQRNSILFAPGAEEPPASALDTVKSMIASLNAALWTGTSHIQLEAYGGGHGDKSSDARRLSLKRALIIRQLLIDDGIPSERIVVKAMGGATSGAPDRVDILVAA